MGASDPMTCLVPDLTGIDPDDSFSIVPYEKGQAFLWYLEELVGGPGTNDLILMTFVDCLFRFFLILKFRHVAEFDPFLKSYIANFQYRSIVTSDFVDYIKHYFKNTPAADKLEKLDWKTWFHTPGLPPTFVKYYLTYISFLSSIHLTDLYLQVRRNFGKHL